MSILEEGSISAIMPMMGVFNNLVLFDQHVRQNRVESIVPELATSWSWSEDGTELSFKLRQVIRHRDFQRRPAGFRIQKDQDQNQDGGQCGQDDA